MDISQRELARVAGVSRTTLGYVEREQREETDAWNRQVAGALGEYLAGLHVGAAVRR
jgi:DNA-binding XRE family transcriptional regulator